MTKNKWWRPQSINKKTIPLLESWFMKGLSDIQACLYANVSTTAFYRYKAKNKKFRDRVEELKDNMLMRAKINISDSINWKWKADKFQRLLDSKRYLERKDNSFSNKQKIEQRNINIDIAESLTKEQMAKMAKRVLKD